MYTKHAIILIPTLLAAESLASIVQIDGAGSYQLQSHFFLKMDAPKATIGSVIIKLIR